MNADLLDGQDHPFDKGFGDKHTVFLQNTNPAQTNGAQNGTLAPWLMEPKTKTCGLPSSSTLIHTHSGVSFFRAHKLAASLGFPLRT